MLQNACPSNPTAGIIPDHFVCFVSDITADFSAFNSFGREKRACDRALKASADRSDFSLLTRGSILFAEKNLHLVVLLFLVILSKASVGKLLGGKISFCLPEITDTKTQPLSRFYSIVLSCAECTPRRRFCQVFNLLNQ
jgi:hypothetical protein